MMTMTFEENNNFTIKDNSSDFAQYLPDKYIEPLTIIARIQGYKGIDDYILALIRGRLQMFVDTGDSVEWEDFQQYMHDMIVGKDVPNEWARATTHKEDEDEKEKEVDEFVKKVNNDESYNDNNLKK